MAFKIQRRCHAVIPNKLRKGQAAEQSDFQEWIAKRKESKNNWGDRKRRRNFNLCPIPIDLLRYFAN